MTSTTPSALRSTASTAGQLGRGALSGLLAAALTLGVAQLLAGFVGTTSSPIIGVGSAVIDATPEALKSFAIATFGTNDKLVLVGSILAILSVAAAVIGILAMRRIVFGWVGIGLFGLVGTVAALGRPGAEPIDALPTVLGAIAGAVALTVLVRAAGEGSAAQASAASSTTSSAGPTRRRFLASAVVVGGLAVVSGGLGVVSLGRRSPSTAAGTSLSIPTPAASAVPVPAGADLLVPGASPFFTPNADFYRVDTALIPPVVDPATWRLRIHGMVERELTLDLPTLLARPTVERDITLTCVSNVVGGPYAGNARWIGIPLKDLLDEVGVRPGADQLVSRSIDGFTVGTPTAAVMDGRDALLAVAMNGEPLPVEHGFPVRMIVPGLYGYVSATKWLVDLELTTFDAFDPYWVERGWAPQAPIKTMTRIDTPKPLSNTPAGEIAVAGVAWAQHRGIAKVEVRIDDGPWAEASLAPADGIDTWRQWVYRWAATSGRHTLSARATDGTGDIQTEERAEPFPDGASGWHSLVVTVS